MRYSGAAALLGLVAGGAAQQFFPGPGFMHCTDEPGCPEGKPGCKKTGNGRPMLARLEMDRQQPHDVQKRYFYLGRGKQVRMSCLHVEHDLGRVNARIVYGSVPTLADVANCEDPANHNCGGNCVWSMSSFTMSGFKAPVQPTDCTRATCQCLALGDTNGDSANTGAGELVESRLFEFHANAADPGHVAWNGVAPNIGISNKDPIIYKAHGGGRDVDFYIQYWTDKGAARLTTPGVNWGAVTAGISFTARVEDPSDYFCFTEAETKMPFHGFDPVMPAVEGEAAIPRHAGFQYMIDKPRTIASASGNDSFWLGVNYRYWDLGTGPQVDLSCVNVWSTMTSVPHSPTEMCTNAQYGWDQMGWNPKVALYGNASTGMTSNLTVDVLDVFDCNAYTMWTENEMSREHTNPIKSDTNPSVYTDPFYSRNLCCYQTTARACAAQKFTDHERHGWNACFWNEQNDMCYPADTLAIRSLKEVQGSTETYTLQSGHVHTPQSSYVVQEGELKGGFSGNTMRRWFLRVGNHMRLNDRYYNAVNDIGKNATSTTCPLSVTVSYKSNTHGGTCEPSGRMMCDTQAELCTKKYAWAVMNGLQWWKKDEAMEHALDKNAKKFNGCNCLKEKEVCYRNVGCTSTKKYQLILQNCYDQQCGDYCNSAGTVRGFLIMAIAMVMAVTGGF